VTSLRPSSVRGAGLRDARAFRADTRAAVASEHHRDRAAEDSFRPVAASGRIADFRGTPG